MITNWLSLSGDQELNRTERLLWLLANLLTSSISMLVDFGFIFKSRKAITLLSSREYFYGVNRQELSETPTRCLTDAILSNLLILQLNKSSRPAIILDIGCGSGKYLTYFRRVFGSRFFRYYGFDIKSIPKLIEKDNDLGTSVFYNDINDFESIVRTFQGDHDLYVFSLSVLEHIRDPEFIVHRISSALATYPLPVYQYHCVPSQLCVFSYPVHGFGQFSAFRISRFPVYPFNSTLISAGTLFAVLVQAAIISLPRLLGLRSLRDVNMSIYKKINLASLVLDSKLSGFLCKWHPLAAFYILCLDNG